MKKIRAAVVGYGNIGKYVVEALESAADFEIAGIVRRASSLSTHNDDKYLVVSSLEELKDVDVAIWWRRVLRLHSGWVLQQSIALIFIAVLQICVVVWMS